MSVHANIDPLLWDSEFFSTKIARLVDINQPGSPLLTAELLKQYDLIQAKVNANDYQSLLALQNSQFQIVDGEIDLIIESIQSHIEHEISLDQAAQIDIPQLQQITHDAFQLSRFRQPWFAEQDNSRFYGTWVEKAVLATFDDICLVVRSHKRIIEGFITLKKITADCARVGLLAVNPAYRQQGVGHKLMQVALAWCQKQKIESLRVATQIGNIAAMRLYINHGATISSSAYWLYRTIK